MNERVRRRLRLLLDRVAGRAWSRAGAVAAVVSTGVPRRVLSTGARLGFLMCGSVLIACSVAVTIWNGLGPGPLDVFIGAVQARTGVPLTFAVWGTVGSLILVATLLGRRPGPGTFLSPFVIGPVIDGVLGVLRRFDAPELLVIAVPVHLVAIAGIGLGAGMLIVSGLGAGSGELLAGAASDRTGQREAYVRLGCESTWILLGVVLGGPAGLGTVLVAAFVGPAVACGYTVADAFAVGTHRRLAATRGVIVDHEIARQQRALVDTLPR